jgi:hypothetical protein
MASDTRSPITVAAAFAAALLAGPATTLAAADARQSDSALRSEATAPRDALEPSRAALQHLEQAATQIRIGPRWIDLWPEVTHVESIRQP